MANGPGDFRDRTGTSAPRSSSRVIGYVVGAIVLLLLLAWLLGLFGADEAAEVDTDEAVVTDEPAVTEEAVEEAAEEAEDAAD